jgi:hypothetical protein
MTLRRPGVPGFVWAKAFETIWNSTANSTSVRLVSSVSDINLIVFLLFSGPDDPDLSPPGPGGSGDLRLENFS